MTALGGGTIRDILLGVFPPRAFYSYEYLAVAFLTALAVFIVVWGIGRAMHVSGRHLRALIIFLMRLVLQLFRLWVHRLPWRRDTEENAFLCVFLGMTTGIGGGILRDVLSKEVPFVFKKHVYGVASLAGCVAYWVILHLSSNDTAATLTGVFLIIAIRICATVFLWNLPRIHLTEK